MNRLLILDDDCTIYQEEVGKHNLPDLHIAVARNQTEASTHISESNIILGSPALVAEVINRAERLQWVQSTYAGVEQLCRPGLTREYLLTGIKGLFGAFMREYVFAYILAKERALLQTYHNQQRKIWSRIPYRSLAETTIGIIGLGSIGREIAVTARHFNMRVLGMKRTASPVECVDHLFTPDQMEAFLPMLDYLVLVLPDTEECRHLISARELALMSPGAVVINVGRGSTVNQSDLIQALEMGHLAGAVLDVFEEEPLPADNPLWSMDGVMISPHNSAYSFPDQVAQIFCTNYLRFTTDTTLNYVVDFNRGY